jgi:hypothetical protein
MPGGPPPPRGVIGDAGVHARQHLEDVLAGQPGTQMTGVVLGAADTDMMAGCTGPMSDPADVVRAGDREVLVDDWSRRVKAALAADPREFHSRPAV